KRQPGAVDAEVLELFVKSYERNWYLSARARVLTALIRPLCREGDRLVDVGAGTGAIVARLKADAWVMGIETDRELARYGRGVNNIPFLVGDVRESIPLSSGSARVALSLDVLEHLDDDRTALREMHRIL